MGLILEESYSFKFNERHFLQTHGFAIGTKMAVAFSVIFMADLETRLLTASPFKPLVWKRFIDDIFSLWNIPIKEVSEFVNFANSCFPWHRGLQGTRHSTHKSLDLQTHFKPTETFQYTHFSSCHPFNSKKGFIKGEALRLLRTNSAKENFETYKREFEQRLCQRAYPLTLVHWSSVLWPKRGSSQQLENKTN